MRWIVDLPTQGQRHIVVSEVVNAGPAVERLDNETGSVPEGSLERPSPKLDAFRAVSLVHAIQLGVSAISWSSSLAVIRSRCIRTFATRSISAQCSSTNSSQFMQDDGQYVVRLPKDVPGKFKLLVPSAGQRLARFQ